MRLHWLPLGLAAVVAADDAARPQGPVVADPASVAAASSYWAKQVQEVAPACFVVPASAADVATAVRILTGGGERDDADGVPFAVRSGGHTPIPGWASLQGGVTIDLSDLKQVDPSPDRKTVAVGPGNRWADVYSKLDAVGLGVSGGRVATVGVGGLVTGGGISFFSRERGFVADAVVNFQVVLASGAVVNANANTNRNLFRALKGGSSNFGIVTRFDLAAFPLGMMWGGMAFHDISQRPALFAYFANYTANTADPASAWIHSYTYLQQLGSWFVTSNVHYTRPVNSTPAILAPALNMPGTTLDVKPASLTALTLQMAETNPAGDRQLFVTLTHVNSAEYMEAFFQIGNATATGLAAVQGLRFSMSYQALSRAVTGFAKRSGGNALGLEEEEEDLILVLLTATWESAADDATVEAAAEAMFADARKKAEEMEVDSPYLYLNYAARFQDPVRGYGEESAEFLGRVARKYDPRRVFQRQVPGGFKLVREW
ncbi:FAD-binding domain-containing protein [Trichodelitschia bisporula]|uniref:FAD-binding domain-containing protein n=1 Tax=Trichodelitschia bisporula TaxID=703511 RepID=A0A6G1I9F2_9PEZI|nr:FAD-binding domain-containing protein [Trichodelitschia bisporula]